MLCYFNSSLLIAFQSISESIEYCLRIIRERGKATTSAGVSYRRSSTPDKRHSVIRPEHIIILRVIPDAHSVKLIVIGKGICGSKCIANPSAVISGCRFCTLTVTGNLIYKTMIQLTARVITGVINVAFVEYPVDHLCCFRLSIQNNRRNGKCCLVHTEVSLNALIHNTFICFAQDSVFNIRANTLGCCFVSRNFRILFLFCLQEADNLRIIIHREKCIVCKRKSLCDRCFPNIVCSLTVFSTAVVVSHCLPLDKV